MKAQPENDWTEIAADYKSKKDPCHTMDDVSIKSTNNKAQGNSGKYYNP